MNHELDGITVQLPSATRNMFVDGSYIKVYPPTPLFLTTFPLAVGAKPTKH